MRARRNFETDFRKALALNEFSLVYQACGNVGSNVLSGFEARLHWDHPIHGGMPEADFLKLAEATGCIAALDEWKLRVPVHD